MTQGSAHPPKARLVLRVGITGHRPNKLGEPGTATYKAVERSVRDALLAIKTSLHRIAGTEALKDVYAKKDPLLRIISALAEGADRMAADEAVAPCSELQVILPFASDEYERDFKTNASKDEFRALMARANGAVMTLDGTRAAENRSYRAAGRMMLRQSDVVIAVWDGEPAESDAGTGAIAAAALSARIPVLWINPSLPDLGARRLTHIKDPVRDPAPKAEDLTAKDVDVLLARLLFPPQVAGHDSGQGKAGREWHAYLKRTWPRWPLLGWAYGLWASLWAWTWLGLGISLPTRAEREDVPWPGPADGLRDEAALRSLEVAKKNNKHLYDYIKTQYLWADQLANYCARQFRGAYVLAFCLAPWAIVAAVLHLSKAKLVIVAVIVGVVVAAAWHRLHARWLACRGLAEQLRQLRILAPLGRAPAQDTGPDSERSWADWHFRAVVREVGLVSANLDEGLRKALAEHVVQELVKDQINYHEVTKERARRIAHTLHWFHYLLFGLTFLVVVLQVPYSFCVFGIDGAGWAIVFSAFGGASIGLANQGEFERIAHSSKAMEEQLRDTLRDFQDLPDVPSVTELGDRAERTAALMLKDVLGWRALFLTRPLEPPA